MIIARMMTNTGPESRNNTTASANDDDNTTRTRPGNPWRRPIAAVWAHNTGVAPGEDEVESQRRLTRRTPGAVSVAYPGAPGGQAARGGWIEPQHGSS